MFATGTTRTRAEAEAALRASLALHDKGQEVDRTGGRQLLRDYLTDWLTLTRAGRKPSTNYNYAALVGHLTDQLGHSRLDQLRPATITAAYEALAQRGRRDGTGGLSSTTVRHCHAVLYGALERAVRDRLIVRNPAADIGNRPKRQRQEMKTWTAPELATFLTSTADDRLHPLWLTAAMTAARRGELLALRWGEIDLRGAKWNDPDLRSATMAIRRNRVAVGYTVVEGTPKTDRSRVVDLDPPTLGALRRWRTAQQRERLAWGPGYAESDYVFTAENGEPLHPHAVAKKFERAVRRSGVPVVRFHDLRHTWATLALANGAPVKVVAERLGHSSPITTMDVYAHAIAGMQADAAARVASLVFGA